MMLSVFDAKLHQKGTTLKKKLQVLQPADFLLFFILHDFFPPSQLLTYGAAIRALFVPDKDGNKEDVVLGFDDMDGYQVSETEKRHFIFDA